MGGIVSYRNLYYDTITIVHLTKVTPLPIGSPASRTVDISMDECDAAMSSDWKLQSSDDDTIVLISQTFKSCEILLPKNSSMSKA